jgi:ribonuclease HII
MNERDDILMQFEREAAANGFRRIAGVDEAGRGPLAGPIVAAAVVLAERVEGLNDSKQLTEMQREYLYGVLSEGAHGIGVAIIDADTIDRHGIQSANYAAMAQAAAGLSPAPDFLLVDGFMIRGCPLPQKSIIKGDSRSASIAAASIVAKVTRDRIMNELDQQYPEYGFARHKGYGTREHLEILARLGPCPFHRKSFAPLSEALVPGMLFD